MTKDLRESFCTKYGDGTGQIQEIFDELVAPLLEAHQKIKERCERDNLKANTTCWYRSDKALKTFAERVGDK